MRCTVSASQPPPHLSATALHRFGRLERRHLFVCDWMRALFIHYEVDPVVLQSEVPFELDLREGRAFVSLVAFTMRNLRPAFGGRLGALLTAPAAAHGLFNVRTYVCHQGERGIYFITEWIPNRLSILIGPHTYGLPYRYGRLDYHHDHEGSEVRGSVDAGRGGRIAYAGRLAQPASFTVCEPGGLAEFFLERYTAFTCCGRRRRLFRIWHEPWPQTSIDIELRDISALSSTGRWPSAARLVGANYSPGVRNVWIGRPRRAVAHGRILEPVRARIN